MAGIQPFVFESDANGNNAINTDSVNNSNEYDDSNNKVVQNRVGNFN